MKSTTMKTLAAAAAALLIAAVFVGAAAGEGSATVGVNYTGLVNIWQNADEMPYWTTNTTGMDIETPLNVTMESKYLAAYNASLSGNLTEEFTDVIGTPNPYLKNIITGWSENSAITNKWNLAKTADVSGGNLVNIGSGADILKVAFKGENLTSGKSYNITIKPVHLALTDSGVLGDVTVDGIALQSTLMSTPFEFAVVPVPNVSAYYFPDYVTVDVKASEPVTVYIYKEHSGDSTNVYAMLTEEYLADYFTNKWEGANVGNAVISLSPSATEFDFGNTALKNTFTLYDLPAGTETIGDSEIIVTLNENMTFVRNVTKVNVNLTNWNTSRTDNYNATADSAKASGEWNFENEHEVTYVVRGGAVNVTMTDAGWDTNVVFANLTRISGNDKAVKDPTWTANVSVSGTILGYNISGISNFGGTKQLTSGQNFTIMKNLESLDGTKLITLIFTGYKMGDANTDKKVDIVDSAVVGVYVLKNNDENFLSHDRRIYADCNSAAGDGYINVNDIRAINAYLVGLDPWHLPPA